MTISQCFCNTLQMQDLPCMVTRFFAWMRWMENTGHRAQTLREDPTALTSVSRSVGSIWAHIIRDWVDYHKLQLWRMSSQCLLHCAFILSIMQKLMKLLCMAGLLKTHLLCQLLAWLLLGLKRIKCLLLAVICWHNLGGVWPTHFTRATAASTMSAT